MKRSTLILVALTVIVGGLSMFGASAGHCGSGARNADDPFGSCESSAAVTCAGTSATAATVSADPNKGVEGCADASDALPVKGRVGVWRNTDGGATVFIDGSDGQNESSLRGWQRYDVRPNEQGKLVCARRGTGGTWYDGTGSGDGSSSTVGGTVDHSVGTGGAGTCS